MKLSEIETADIPVREMTITDSQITILYDEVYHIPTQSYIKNIQITITNWRELLVKIFLSPAPYIKPTDAPYIKPTEVICEGAHTRNHFFRQCIDSKGNQQRKPILDGVLYHRGAMGITIDIPLFLSQKNPPQRPQKGYKQ